MLKYRPSLRIERQPDETVTQLIDRVTADPRCLPDQRETLLQDRGRTNGFDDCCQAIWMEQAPVEIRGDGHR